MGEAGFPGKPGITGSRLGSRLHAFLFHGLRLFLGAVFLYASRDKILHPQAFAEAVYNCQILPDFAVNFTAPVLPWVEVAIALCLIAGVWLPGASVITTSLLAVFLGALVFKHGTGAGRPLRVLFRSKRRDSGRHPHRGQGSLVSGGIGLCDSRYIFSTPNRFLAP